MNSKLALPLFLLLIFTGCMQSEDWKEFKPDGAGFSVLMPGTPQDSSQKLPAVAGDIPNHLYTATRGDQAFIVGYNDIPERLNAAGKTEKLLNGARDGAASKGTIREEKKIALDGNPGREIVIDSPNGIASRMRIYLVKNRFYQTLVSVRKGKENDADVFKMLDSFKLTENDPPAKANRSLFTGEL